VSRLALLAICSLLPLIAPTGASAAKSSVYFAMDPASLTTSFTASPAVVRRMVDSVVVAATGKRTVAEAWGSLVKPSDIVGIKVAASGGGVSGTKPAVVDAIVSGLQLAGVPAANIIVWDRNYEDLATAGYRSNPGGYRLRWIDPVGGYDRKAAITAPVLGRLIWGDSQFGEKTGSRFADVIGQGDQLSNKSHFSKILSHEVTKVINVPSLSESFLSGINGALANMTLTNIDNWRRFTRPPDFGDPYVAEIYADPMVHDKVVLNILDGLTLQFAGGPFPNPDSARQYFTVFASRDPVALDATALRLLEEYRLANRLPPLAPMAQHISSAEAMGLGNAKESDIETLRVGEGNLR